jgi:hypothetical protein
MNSGMTDPSGSCHCGEVRFAFRSSKPFAPRACQCGFCRRHNARSVSDPEGEVVLTLGPETRRYRFGTCSSDFLICGRCGIYVGALAELGDGTYAVLNLNAFDEPRLELSGEPMVYDGESVEQRAARRRQRWTPARIVQA